MKAKPPTPESLSKNRFLAQIRQLDGIDMADSDTKGDLYEYMLGKIVSAGQNGQFRTPRHIIELMVEMTAPHARRPDLRSGLWHGWLSHRCVGLFAKLDQSGKPSLVHYVLSFTGMDRTAAQRAFSQFLNEPSLAPSQRRFIEMVIDQFTNRGFMEVAELYESPFTNLHASGPEALFAGKKSVIDGIFQTLAWVTHSTEQP